MSDAVISKAPRLSSVVFACKNRHLHAIDVHRPGLDATFAGFQLFEAGPSGETTDAGGRKQPDRRLRPQPLEGLNPVVADERSVCEPQDFCSGRERQDGFDQLNGA
ncbi:hypothetical protein [Deinococcus ruber]|uniref:hypothetical protein n=1 Tax=Deinococcus ruber TaxID=1848197 RepID=UPI00166B9A32|nr:hypothetical protein [Deinococcus ruber]